MLENILKFENVQEIKKEAQKTINGGKICTYPCSEIPDPEPFPCICLDF
ncbi:hypothetical protein [Tenacibaculum amylolyticum]